mgnify:CR=1 FL=1
MKWQKHYLYTLSIWATLSYLFAQDPFVIDSSLSNSLPQTLSNSIQLADVNNDGYTDIIVSGYDSTRSGLYIDIRLGSSNGTLSQGYQTNFITYPDTIAEYLGGLGNMTLSDVNLDGSIDLYINGSAKSKLLFNSSSGYFSESSWLQNMSVTYSDGKWGDVNMDGRPDLFLMGVNEYSDNILNELFIYSPALCISPFISPMVPTPLYIQYDYYYPMLERIYQYSL